MRLAKKTYVSPSTGARERAEGGNVNHVVKNKPETRNPNQYILGRPDSNGRAKTVLSSSITSGEGLGKGFHLQAAASGGVLWIDPAVLEMTDD
jgi:hypothetical protein